MKSRVAAAAALASASALLLCACAPGATAETTTPQPEASESTILPVATGPAPDDRIAFARFAEIGDEPMLWTSNIDGSDQRPVGEQSGYFPDWSPDRTHLLFDFFDADGRDHIATIRPDGTGFTQLTTGDEFVYNEAADYAPDGATIVFDRAVVPEGDPDFSTTLWVMNADGSDQRVLLDPAQAGFDYEPEYSPDGTEIVFVRYDVATDTAAAFVANADGSGVRQASPYVNQVEHPRWSPDGGLIIYNVEYRPDLDDPRNGIWTVPAAGGEPTMLLATTARLHGFKPDYSPDGTRIVFGCLDRGTGVEDICVMASDGTEVRRVIRTAEYENHPIWD